MNSGSVAGPWGMSNPSHPPPSGGPRPTMEGSQGPPPPPSHHHPPPPPSSSSSFPYPTSQTGGVGGSFRANSTQTVSAHHHHHHQQQQHQQQQRHENGIPFHSSNTQHHQHNQPPPNHPFYPPASESRYPPQNGHPPGQHEYPYHEQRPQLPANHHYHHQQHPPSSVMHHASQQRHSPPPPPPSMPFHAQRSIVDASRRGYPLESSTSSSSMSNMTAGRHYYHPPEYHPGTSFHPDDHSAAGVDPYSQTGAHHQPPFAHQEPHAEMFNVRGHGHHHPTSYLQQQAPPHFLPHHHSQRGSSVHEHAASHGAPHHHHHQPGYPQPPPQQQHPQGGIRGPNFMNERVPSDWSVPGGHRLTAFHPVHGDTQGNRVTGAGIPPPPLATQSFEGPLGENRPSSRNSVGMESISGGSTVMDRHHSASAPRDETVDPREGSGAMEGPYNRILAGARENNQLEPTHDQNQNHYDPMQAGTKSNTSTGGPKESPARSPSPPAIPMPPLASSAASSCPPKLKVPRHYPTLPVQDVLGDSGPLRESRRLNTRHSVESILPHPYQAAPPSWYQHHQPPSMYPTERRDDEYAWGLPTGSKPGPDPHLLGSYPRHVPKLPYGNHEETQVEMSARYPQKPIKTPSVDEASLLLGLRSEAPMAPATSDMMAATGNTSDHTGSRVGPPLSSPESRDAESQTPTVSSLALADEGSSTPSDLESTCVSVIPKNYPKRLALPNDEAKLNSLHCFIRSELLEIFVVEPSKKKDSTAASTEVDWSRQYHRLPSNTSTGKVGLRCVHCTMACRDMGKLDQQVAPMAVFYPKSVSEIYRLVTSWQRCHLRRCTHLPPTVRKKWDSLRDQDKSRGKTAYWITSAREIGLVDCPSRAGGIRFHISCSTASITTSEPTVARHDASTMMTEDDNDDDDDDDDEESRVIPTPPVEV